MNSDIDYAYLHSEDKFARYVFEGIRVNNEEPKGL